jgi:ankyrin repeat protein
MKKNTHTILGQLSFALTVLMALALIPSAQAESALWDAISSNDIGKAKALIASGADVNQKNGYGNPIIHHAVSGGNPELVELLIAKGAKVNVKGQFDRVALHYANKKGMAKILLAHGATVDAPTNYGETPLHWAASGVNGLHKQVDLVEFADVLIAHGADVNRKTGEGRSYKTPLNYAAESNNLAVAKLLIARGADVEGGGSSPLSSAGVNGDFVEIAQLLVENGAGVNTPSPTGWYPLQTAAGRGNIKVTNYLLARGADPNAADRAGFTALYAAAGSDYGASTAEALLSHRANPNAKNMHGRTALHQAASQSAAKVIEVLLTHKADVNAVDKNNETPLNQAIRYGKNDSRKAVVVILLRNGADVNIRNTRDGTTSLFNAISRGDVDITKLLIASGADPNIMGAVGNIALYLARDSKAITELLKEHGAHPASSIPAPATGAKSSDSTAKEGLVAIYNLLPSENAKNPILHAIGVYQARSKEIVVNVSDDTRPIVLALSAYDATHWKIKPEAGVIIEKIILSGYHTQRVSGVHETVRIETYTYESSPCGQCVALVRKSRGTTKPEVNCGSRGCSDDDVNYFYSYREPPRELKEITGLDITSFQGRYEGSEFSISHRVK